MESFRVLIYLFLCATWHVSPVHGELQVDTNVLARLDNIEKQVIGQNNLLEVQSKLIAELQTRVANQESTIAQHQSSLDKQQSTIVNQQKTILEQRVEISNQQSNLSEQHRRLLRLERILKVGKTDKGNRNEEMTQAYSDKNDNDSDDVHYTESGRSNYTQFDHSGANNDQNATQDRAVGNAARRSSRRLVLGYDGPVAFHAVNTDGQTTHASPGHKIMFPKVNINLGAGFQSQNALFVAPTAGIYIFSTSILGSVVAAHAEVQVAILKNGRALAKAYAHGDSGRHDQGSVTIVTQLAIGDEVWVSEVFIADASYWGMSFTSFMGYLLSPQ